MRMPARVVSAGAITGSVCQPCRVASAMASSQSCRALGERVGDGGEAEVGAAGDFDVGPADVVGQGGAFAQVSFAVG